MLQRVHEKGSRKGFKRRVQEKGEYLGTLIKITTRMLLKIGNYCTNYYTDVSLLP